MVGVARAIGVAGAPSVWVTEDPLATFTPMDSVSESEAKTYDVSTDCPQILLVNLDIDAVLGKGFGKTS